MTAVYYSSSRFYFVGMRLIICHSTLQALLSLLFPLLPVLGIFSTLFSPSACLIILIPGLKYGGSSTAYGYIGLAFCPRLYIYTVYATLWKSVCERIVRVRFMVRIVVRDRLSLV